MRLRVILTDRDYSETVKSLELQTAGLPIDQRQPALQASLGLQEKLRDALENPPQHALVVRHSELRSEPRIIAARIADMLGIEVDLNVATRGIWGA